MRKRLYTTITAAMCLMGAAAISLTAWTHHRPSVTSPYLTDEAATQGLSGFVVFYDDGGSGASWMKHATSYNEVYLDTATIRPDATIINSTPASALQFIQRNHLNAYLCVSNYGTDDFDGRELDKIFHDPKKESKLVENLVQTVNHTPLIGVNIDFEQSPAADANKLVAFLSDLRVALHAEHKRLSIDVPAKTADDSWDDGYDISAIAKNTDEVLVMAYDYSYPGGPAGPIAPVWWLKDVLDYATAHIPNAKLRIGLPTYAYDWHGKQTDALTLGQVHELMAKHKAIPQWDAKGQAPYFHYSDASGKHTVYYENARSLGAELKLIRQYGVPGVFTWYVGSEDTGAWNALRTYQPN